MKDFQVSKIYTVGDEQDYHFKVPFEVLKRLLKNLLPTGFIIFRTVWWNCQQENEISWKVPVVDADDIISEVIQEAALLTAERSEISHLSETEKADIIRKIG